MKAVYEKSINYNSDKSYFSKTYKAEAVYNI